MPKSIEAWYQEIGRAGRDGLGSDCIVYFSWADVIGYDSFLSGVEDAELREETRRKTVELFRLLDRGTCRHQAACAYFDEALEPCGASCDVCAGVGVGDLVATVAGKASAARRNGPGGTPDLDDAGAERFERLRALRKRIADAEGVPAYIVFSDAVLRHLASLRPQSAEQMLRVPGIGPAKLQRYGAAFLEALAEG
jgi:ATP-dependent DNA helicase RecQ